MHGPDPRNWKATSVPKRAKRIKRSFSSLVSACLPACLSFLPCFLPFFLSLVRYIAGPWTGSRMWPMRGNHKKSQYQWAVLSEIPWRMLFVDRWTVSGDVFRRPRRSWADVSYLWTGTRKVCPKNGTLNHGSPGPSGWPILTYAPYDFNSHIRYQFLSGLNDPFGPFSFVCLQNLGTINTGHSKTLAFYTCSLYVDQGLDHWRWFAGANATRTPTWKDIQNCRPWDVEKGWVHSCRPFGRSNE